MFDKVCFYNNFHHGDLHLCRGFINYIIDNSKNIDFYCVHNKNEVIYKDINIQKISTSYFNNMDQLTSFERNGILYINTWIGTDKFSYIYKHGLTFDCLFNIFNDACKRNLSISLDGIDPSKLFPAINFSKFNISNVDKWILDHKNSKKVYISNGYVESCQCDNSNWNSLIIYFANKHKDIDFLISNKIEPLINLKNVFYTGDIINSSCCDLNENGYISTFCDLIIGRASGAYEFARNTTNLFERNCQLISFSNMDDVIGRKMPVHAYEDNYFWIGDSFRQKIKYSSRLINYQNQDIKFIEQIIEKEIKNII